MKITSQVEADKILKKYGKVIDLNWYQKLKNTAGQKRLEIPDDLIGKWHNETMQRRTRFDKLVNIIGAALVILVPFGGAMYWGGTINQKYNTLDTPVQNLQNDVKEIRKDLQQINIPLINQQLENIKEDLKELEKNNKK